MSQLGHRRALKRLEEAKWGRKGEGLTWEEHEAIFKRNLEATAAEEIVRCARALAGTDEATRLQQLASSPRERPEQPAARTAPPPRRDSRPVWSQSVRPGPNDVLTWEQAMRVTWLDGTSAAVATTQVRADPEHPRDPWENWGLIGPPSYDGEEE